MLTKNALNINVHMREEVNPYQVSWYVRIVLLVITVLVLTS